MTDENLPAELQKDVKVALLDDGANFMHKAIKGQLENGRSFDSGSENPDLSGNTPGPFHGSTTGHGTYMAYMIGRVCPSVKIFVCKMNVIRQDGGAKARFTAKSAADVSTPFSPTDTQTNNSWLPWPIGPRFCRQPRLRHHFHVVDCPGPRG